MHRWMQLTTVVLPGSLLPHQMNGWVPAPYQAQQRIITQDKPKHMEYSLLSHFYATTWTTTQPIIPWPNLSKFIVTIKAFCNEPNNYYHPIPNIPETPSKTITICMLQLPKWCKNLTQSQWKSTMSKGSKTANKKHQNTQTPNCNYH